VTTAASRSIDEDLEIVRAMFAAFEAGDEKSVIALADPGIVLASIITGERLGRPTEYIGQQGLREYFHDVATVWEELRFTPREFRRVGSAVLVTGRVVGRAPGQILTGSARWIWRVRGGKVAHIQVFPSAADALAAARPPGG
jgi:ketosteroid isomerase-like protein